MYLATWTQYTVSIIYSSGFQTFSVATLYNKLKFTPRFGIFFDLLDKKDLDLGFRYHGAPFGKHRSIEYFRKR